MSASTGQQVLAVVGKGSEKVKQRRQFVAVCGQLVERVVVKYSESRRRQVAKRVQVVVKPPPMQVRRRVNKVFGKLAVPK